MKINLKQLRKLTEGGQFSKIYTKLLRGLNSLSDEEIARIFRISLILINYGDYNVKKFGYSIILKYSNLTGNYEPLHDLCTSLGYVPIVKFMEKKELVHRSESFNDIFVDSLFETYLYKNKYLTSQQKSLFFDISNSKQFIMVAPTSYGKSEIINEIARNNLDKNICILVPTKALLAQTRKQLSEDKIILKHFKQIIVHPDMYKQKRSTMNILCVFTQERLLRLLQKTSSLKFDLILVDEAHNLLENNERSLLLTEVLMITNRRNENLLTNYFTPFLVSPQSLDSIYVNDLGHEEKRITEHLKIEKFYLIENSTLIEKKVCLYDQFLNKFTESYSMAAKNEMELIVKLNTNEDKCIIYVNKTRDLQKAAKKLTKNVNDGIVISDEIQTICKDISSFLHKDYDLLDCLKKGILYHHGSMPDLIRLYVEHLYKKYDFFKYIVTSSTLLEGVNLPASRLFILSNQKGSSNLTPSQFKNLVGRVCRLNAIFNSEKGSLSLLEPEIYLIENSFMRKNANLSKYIKNSTQEGITLKDKIDNVLLTNNKKKDANKDKIFAELQKVENIEPGTVKLEGTKFVYATTEVGKICFKNNITEFDIIADEKIVETSINNIKGKISDTTTLLEQIYMVFLSEFLKVVKNDNALMRLREKKARIFYTMLLDWRTKGSSYNYLINSYLRYWEEKIECDELGRALVYVGTKWGEVKRTPKDFRELYVDIKEKTVKERVNLAIVRIKEEQDFIDNKLMKYIEALNDLKLLESDFYDQLKYGTKNKNVICLLKNGFSLDLAHEVTKDEYSGLIVIDLENDIINISNGIEKQMRTNSVNDILIFEIGYHIIND